MISRAGIDNDQHLLRFVDAGSRSGDRAFAESDDERSAATGRGSSLGLRVLGTMGRRSMTSDGERHFASQSPYDSLDGAIVRSKF